MTDSKIIQQSIDFANRLQKRKKHLQKWVKREHIQNYRLYDNDIPEIPLLLEIFTEHASNIQYVHLTLYERPYDKPHEEEEIWLSAMIQAASSALAIPLERFFVKLRKKQHGKNQYAKFAKKTFTFIIQEQGLFFKINLSDYLDSGLFLDMRILRKKIQAQSDAKNVLNLFCYTASFSVYAACGKANSVVSVDLSKTYLAWAKENFLLNTIAIEKKNSTGLKYEFIHADIFDFFNTLQKEKKFDIIILDPPTFSNSKKTQTVLDIQKDWSVLINKCLNQLSSSGVLYFSTNSQKLRFDVSQIPNATSYTFTNISEQTIPEDFRNKKIHQCWEIKKIANYKNVL